MKREEAIKILEETSIVAIMFGDKNMVAVCDFAISALREQEERRWIPVNDRLPKEDGFYRVYHKNSKAICDRFYYKDCPICLSM